MITPVMISNIGWGTYLFFAVVNACFLPVIYFLYPETKQRSLEEIDIIFAKGYMEGQGITSDEKVGGMATGREGGKWGAWIRGDKYVRAARELEFLTDEDIDRKAREYGLVLDEAKGGMALTANAVGSGSGIDSDLEKEL